MSVAPLVEQQYQYYCVEHPGKFATWCAEHAHHAAQAIEQHKHHFFPISDLERLHKMMSLLDNSYVFWAGVVVGAYFVGRIGLPALWSDVTGLISKVKGMLGGSTSTGTTPTGTPAPTGTA